MRIFTDLSSILWSCLRAGKDPAPKHIVFGDKKLEINTAEYAYENVINSVKATLEYYGSAPIDLVLVEEGISSKLPRTMIDQGYKSKRAEKAPEEYEEFQKLRDMIIDLFKKLGCIHVVQDCVEGDDVLAYLARNSEEDCVVFTNDGDLLALMGVNKHGATVVVRQNGEEAVNKYGPFHPQLITLYKALVGDTSDTIPGCKGFGKAKFMDLATKYDEEDLFTIMRLMDEGSLAPLNSMDSCPLIHMILMQEEQVLRCYELVKLHDEWVDSRQKSLQWYPGMVHGAVNDERLVKWAAQRKLVTNANLMASYKFLVKHLAFTKEPSFDIETSSLPEADDWLEAQGKTNGVDPLGSKLAGFSLTFGDNMQYTYYFAVDHRDTDNIALDDARAVLEAVWATGKKVAIQNVMFEGAVLHETEENGKKWSELWKDNGYRGYVPNWTDTAIMASYVNENVPRGLKFRSKLHLGYDQVTYEAVTCKTGLLDSLPSGGRVKQYHEDGIVTKQYKMNELTGQEVLDYGCDDTVTTSALSGFYRLRMQMEHHFSVYEKVELSASYLHCNSYVVGKEFSLATMNEQRRTDDVTFDAQWVVLRDYLVKLGWEGTAAPVFTVDSSVKDFKYAYRIWNGLIVTENLANSKSALTSAEDEEDNLTSEDNPEEDSEESSDPILSSRVRLPAKFIPLLEANDHKMFAEMVQSCLNSEVGAAEFTKAIRSRFSGEPAFKGSNVQMRKLMYDTMGFEPKVFNKPTAKMRKEGKRIGTPKGDALALRWALLEASDTSKPILEALQLLSMVATRRKLYYNKYPGYLHWKTGRVHSHHQQCHANTRRASVVDPNDQQLPKHAKIDNQPAEFRATIKPHKKGAVVVSLDFVQQELVYIADQSQDPNMLACYVGDNRKDMHVLTALGIIKRKHPEEHGDWTYEQYVKVYSDASHADYKRAKKYRGQGKTTNFTTEFGAQAEKVGNVLLVSKEEAQSYIDAKEEAFPGVVLWKKDTIMEAKHKGFVTTLMGARRHLRELFDSDDWGAASKAERQSVNFKVQSSSAEQTKLAEGRIWESDILDVFDCQYYGPIHDELVFSIMIEDLCASLPRIHTCMTQRYATMTLPNRSSISFGLDFYHQIEIGEEATEVAVTAGLKEMLAEV